MLENKSKFNELKDKMKEIFFQTNNTDMLFTNLENAKQVMISNGIDNKTANQICLIFECSNVKTYLSMDNITVIDANNCLNQVVSNTDLNKYTVKKLLSVIFYAFGFQAVSDEFDKSEIIQIKKSIKEFDLINPNQTDSKEILDRIDQYVEKGDTVELAHNAHVLENLVKNGDAYALYIKGKCLLKGIGTTADIKQAEIYLKRSSSKGFAKANSLLADIEYEKENYTLAYQYYTEIGTVALSEENQKRVIAILKNKKLNIRTFIGFLIVIVLIVIFNVLMATGSFCPSGCTHYPSGIISIIASIAILILMIFNMIFQKYDSPRLLVLLNAITTSVFAFFALVI